MDYIPHVIADIGSNTIRLGRAGECNPVINTPSQVGILQSSSDPLIGSEELNQYHEGLKMKQIVDQDSYISDYDIFAQILDKARNKDVSIGAFLTEPAQQRKENRAKLVEQIFEKLSFEQMFIAKAPVLSSFSVGCTTSLVFDSGENNTYAVPVHDGYISQSTIQKSKVAGNVISENVKKFLTNQAFEIDPISILEADNYDLKELNLAKKDIHESVYAFHIERMVKKIKHDLLECSIEPISKRDPSYEFESKTYSLPDGKSFTVKGEQFKIPEVFFISDSSSSEEQKEPKDADAEMQADDQYNQKLDGFNGFQGLVQKAINASEMDIRRDLYK